MRAPRIISGTRNRSAVCGIPAIPAIRKDRNEYEGELKGAETIARDLIRQSVQMVFRILSRRTSRGRSNGLKPAAT
jgi:hypothetical protein